MKKYGIRHAYLFGSYAKGTQREDSDIDILYECPENISLLDHCQMDIEQEENLKKKVHTVTEAAISPWIREEAMKHLIPLF